MNPESVPALWKLARMDFDAVRKRPVLLYPEGAVLLNDTGEGDPGAGGREPQRRARSPASWASAIRPTSPPTSPSTCPTWRRGS